MAPTGPRARPGPPPGGARPQPQPNVRNEVFENIFGRPAGGHHLGPGVPPGAHPVPVRPQYGGYGQPQQQQGGYPQYQQQPRAYPAQGGGGGGGGSLIPGPPPGQQGGYGGQQQQQQQQYAGANGYAPRPRGPSYGSTEPPPNPRRASFTPSIPPPNTYPANGGSSSTTAQAAPTTSYNGYVTPAARVDRLPHISSIQPGAIVAGGPALAQHPLPRSSSATGPPPATMSMPQPMPQPSLPTRSVSNASTLTTATMSMRSVSGSSTATHASSATTVSVPPPRSGSLHAKNGPIRVTIPSPTITTSPNKAFSALPRTSEEQSTLDPGNPRERARSHGAASPPPDYLRATHPPNAASAHSTPGGLLDDIPGFPTRSDSDLGLGHLSGPWEPTPAARPDQVRQRPPEVRHTSTASSSSQHRSMHSRMPSDSSIASSVYTVGQNQRIAPLSQMGPVPDSPFGSPSTPTGSENGYGMFQRIARKSMESTHSLPLPNASVRQAAILQTMPVIIPALLSSVAGAFRQLVDVSEIVKEGITYKDAFDGRTAVTIISDIIKTPDRNLALLLGRALDAQKFFHDVTYAHRLRDTPNEIYQFKERLVAPFVNDSAIMDSPGSEHIGLTRPPSSSSGTAPTARKQIGYDALLDSPVLQTTKATPVPGGTPLESDDSEDDLPNGVFTLLTECYSPTCSREQLCYSINCPRRLEQMKRLNVKSAHPGLSRKLSEESLHDEPKETGTLWIHSVSQDILDSVDDTEKKRQEAINEVIYTERDFVRDLEYLRDSWVKPLRTQDIVSSDRRDEFVRQVFWNVHDVLQVNHVLAERLTKRQKQQPVVQSLGDIFLDCVPHFEPFVVYGAHQLWGKYEFEKEKNTNPAFQKFVDETERKPESRKLELNGYLTKPTTRLGRYPLLLEAVLKYTPEDHSDKRDLPEVIKMIKAFLSKVNVESGKSENAFELAQIDKQIMFRQGDNIDLRLRDRSRELVHKGPVKRRGGNQGGENADLIAFLFDHAFLLVKSKWVNKAEQYKVYRRPIPLELLVLRYPEDHYNSAKLSAGTNNKLIRAGGPAGKAGGKSQLAHIPPKPESKHGFFLNVIHLGRKGYELQLWIDTYAGRRKWIESIEKQQQVIRDHSTIFVSETITEGFFQGLRRINCLSPYDNGNRMIYGTDEGVYFSNLRDPKLREPVKVINLVDVAQVDVIEEYQLLIVLSERQVTTFPLDCLDPNDPNAALKRGKRVSSHTSFFKSGVCLGRTLVAVVKSSPLSSTIKVLEPVDQSMRGKKPQGSFMKSLKGAQDTLKVFKEFYIPFESFSVYFLKTKLCVGCQKGFEIVDLETLDLQSLLDPSDQSLDFVLKREGVRPMAIYRIESDFLLCYDDFAFYVNKNGWRARPKWAIVWEGAPTAFALLYPYVIAFEPTFVEVRHVETGHLVQIIPGSHITCLFADMPPSTVNAPVPQQRQIMYPQQPGNGQMYRPPPGQFGMPQGYGYPPQGYNGANGGRPPMPYGAPPPMQPIRNFQFRPQIIFVSDDGHVQFLKLPPPNGNNRRSCVNALSWSDDGAVLLSGSDDKRICMWTADTRSGIAGSADSPHPLRLRESIITGHQANIFWSSFLPSAGPPRIVSCAGDSDIRVFDVEKLSWAPTLRGKGALDGRSGAGVTILRCHSDRTKRIATEASPFQFLSVSEDGTVRQHDLRRPHACPGECPTPLFRAPDGVDLYSLSLSPAAPHVFAVAGQTDAAYVLDRRMLARQTPSWGEHTKRAGQVHCVRRLGLPDDEWEGVSPSRSGYDGERHITCVKLNPDNPAEAICAFAKHSTALFNLNDSPVETSAAATSEHGVVSPNPSRGRAQTDTVGVLEAQQEIVEDVLEDAEAAVAAEAGRTDTQAVPETTDTNAGTRQPHKRRHSEVSTVTGDLSPVTRLRTEEHLGGADEIDLDDIRELEEDVLAVVSEAEGETVFLFDDDDEDAEETGGDDDSDSGEEIDLSHFGYNLTGDGEDEDEDEEDDDDDDEDDSDDDSNFGFRRGARSATGQFGSVPLLHPRRMFKGARNVETVKDCTFLGDSSDKIASGSDDGNFFVWDKVTGRLEGIWEGDNEVVNVMSQHPTLPVIAVSGIDSTVKVFAPTASRLATSHIRTADVDRIIQRNKYRPRPARQFNPFSDRTTILQYLTNYVANNGLGPLEPVVGDVPVGRRTALQFVSDGQTISFVHRDIGVEDDEDEDDDDEEPMEDEDE
ncbi:Rho1 guanine nucleotide exchange factor 1 [Vanrija pseudolonga]|uniref:Rho1 guanine nucleotide exchange factor 1 n=1 Tax=Vanrija pseudolonga TaxID=143232 RepID=A0AAF1BK71_9TREE|nr:Rho1 guanine nucleotide exchange factor 1 [Vanrija pseudolonga]